MAATGGNDARTGLDYWTNAVLTISQGVAKAASAGDVVLVSNGTYNLAATVTMNNRIVRGFAGRDNTFVSGGGTVRCFSVSGGAAGHFIYPTIPPSV